MSAAERHRATQARLRAAMEGMPYGAAVSDEIGRIQGGITFADVAEFLERLKPHVQRGIDDHARLASDHDLLRRNVRSMRELYALELR